MPCYNYCPIATATHRTLPKHEDSPAQGDCECGERDSGCGSKVLSGGCCGGSLNASPKTAGSRPKLLVKEPRSVCPMIGDIENWPPVYEDEDVQVLSTLDIKCLNFGCFKTVTCIYLCLLLNPGALVEDDIL